MKLMRLRFSIRDLLWLTALLALAVGWWLDHQLQSRWRYGTEMQRDLISRWYEGAASQLFRIRSEHPEIGIDYSGPPPANSIVAP